MEMKWVTTCNCSEQGLGRGMRCVCRGRLSLGRESSTLVNDAGKMWVLTQGLLGSQPLGQSLYLLYYRVMFWVVTVRPKPSREETTCRAQAKALPAAPGTCDPDPLHALCALGRTRRGLGLSPAAAGKGSRAPGIPMGSYLHLRERVEARDILRTPRR